MVENLLLSFILYSENWEVVRSILSINMNNQYGSHSPPSPFLITLWYSFKTDASQNSQ